MSGKEPDLVSNNNNQNQEMVNLAGQQNEPPKLDGNSAPVTHQPGDNANPNAAYKIEAGACGCKSTQGIVNGGLQKLDRSKLVFDPAKECESYDRFYIGLAEADFDDYVGKCALYCCTGGRVAAFKVYGTNADNDVKMPIPLYSVTQHVKCSCSNCSCIALCTHFPCALICCNAIVSQADYKVRGTPFATMGKYLSSGKFFKFFIFIIL